MDMERRKQQGLGLDHLPDEILVCILSRLSLKDAIRTSAISKRWTTLWRFTSGSLDFDFLRDAKGLIESTEHERSVSRILELHKGTSIERFSAVCVSPRNELIDYWLTLVIGKEIKHFELYFFSYYTLHLEKFLVILEAARPQKVFSCLISVHLLNVHVDDELIEYLLSHCPQLEKLMVNLSTHVENLKVVGPSMKSLEILSCYKLNSLKVSCPLLKSLKICKCSTLELVEISAENPVTLIYHGEQAVKLELHNVCILWDLHIGGDFCRTLFDEPTEPEMLCFFPCGLEKIKLHVSIEVLYTIPEFWYFPDESHPFIYIKQLELQIEACVGEDLLFFVTLVRGCPVLSELVVKLLYQQEFSMQDNFDKTSDKLLYWANDFFRIDIGYLDRKHDFLKVVKVINFAACESDFKFAWMLLKVATGLEKMLIRPMQTSIISLAEARVRAQKLKQNLPPTAKLLIF